MARTVNTERLLATAQASTGLSDWGDPTLPERFALVVDKINASGMNDDGMAIAERHCHLLLATRLQFFEDRNRYPIGNEVIERPMFATGETRSGTTLMHALMSVDPDSRSLRFWEVTYPSPPPGITGPGDSRPAKSDDDWREVNRVLSTWLRAHPYNDMLGGGLPECERTWSFDFRVMTPDCWLLMPMAPVVDLPANDKAQYGIHKMMLQQLQYKRPKKRWALKGFHGHRLEALFETYPDANIVWLHRDPVQVAASFTAMVHHIYDGILEIDLRETAKMAIARLRANIMTTLTNPMINDPRIYHLRFSDFVKDPIGEVRGYYEFCGREFTPAAEVAMREYLQNNPADRHGKFHYSTELLTDVDGDLEALHEECRLYRERFGVMRENRE